MVLDKPSRSIKTFCLHSTTNMADKVNYMDKLCSVRLQSRVHGLYEE